MTRKRMKMTMTETRGKRQNQLDLFFPFSTSWNSKERYTWMKRTYFSSPTLWREFEFTKRKLCTFKILSAVLFLSGNESLDLKSGEWERERRWLSWQYNITKWSTLHYIRCELYGDADAIGTNDRLVFKSVNEWQWQIWWHILSEFPAQNMRTRLLSSFSPFFSPKF